MSLNQENVEVTVGEFVWKNLVSNLQFLQKFTILQNFYLLHIIPYITKIHLSSYMNKYMK